MRWQAAVVSSSREFLWPLPGLFILNEMVPWALPGDWFPTYTPKSHQKSNHTNNTYVSTFFPEQLEFCKVIWNSSELSFRTGQHLLTTAGTLFQGKEKVKRSEGHFLFDYQLRSLFFLRHTTFQYIYLSNRGEKTTRILKCICTGCTLLLFIGGMRI